MALDINAIKMKVAELGQAVEKRLPHYPSILQVIHANLKEQPELVYMLADDEIATLISGLEHFHKVEVSEPKVKKPISKKQGMLLSSDDV